MRARAEDAGQVQVAVSDRVGVQVAQDRKGDARVPLGPAQGEGRRCGQEPIACVGDRVLGGGGALRGEGEEEAARFDEQVLFG